MIDGTILAAFKTVGTVLAGPLVALFAWIAKRLYRRVDAMEAALIKTEKELAVQASQLKDIKDDIHQINKKLDRLIEVMSSDRRLYRRGPDD